MSNEQKDYAIESFNELNQAFREGGVNCLPGGWRGTFINDLVRDLYEVLGPYYASHFKVLDIKEKYGELRLYWDWDEEIFEMNSKEDILDTAYKYDKVEEIIEKYSKKSLHTCTQCGKQENVKVDAYVGLPLCKHCAKRFHRENR